MTFSIPAKYETRISHGLTKTRCNKAIAATLKELPWVKIGFLKNAYDYKTLSSSLLVLGERIVIYVGDKELYIKSSCLNPAQFLDFGKNKKNITLFLKLFTVNKEKLM